MKKNKNIGIVLEFGFHEYKKFIQSGFAFELAKKYNILWLIPSNKNEFEGFEVVPNSNFLKISIENLYSDIDIIEKLNLKIRKQWMVDKNINVFSNHKILKPQKRRNNIYISNLVKYIFEIITLRYVKKKYLNLEIGKLLIENNIDLILTTGYSSKFAKQIITTSIYYDIKIDYIINSWKDLFVNNFIPTDKFNAIYFWSEKMIVNYLEHAKYLSRCKLINSGNLTFDVQINYYPKFSRLYYSRKYNLKESSTWILYSMMPIGINENEIHLINYIGKQLYNNTILQNDYSIIIRRNPTNQKSDYNDLNLCENVKLSEHYCSFDYLKNTICQTIEGEIEWLDLLYYSEINFSVPSTVTLEFLLMDKFVFNIEFDINNNLEENVAQFFNAEYYKEYFNNPKVLRVKTIEQLIELLNKIKIKQIKNNIYPQKATDIILQNIDKTLNRQ